MRLISTTELATTWKSIAKPGFGWVLFRFPGMDKIYFTGGISTEQYIDKEGIAGFAIAPFYSSDHKLWCIENTLEYQLSSRAFNELSDLFSMDTSAPVETIGITKDAYINLVENTISEIESGTIQKAVPARMKQVDLSDQFSAFGLFDSLLDTYPNAFVYLLNTPQTGTWIGSTPETLLKISDNELSTLSLAGTKKSGTGDNHDFTSKETEEQAIVTRYIHEILEKYCSEIIADGPYPINAGNVFHLATYFKGQLKSGYRDNFLKIVKDLHPTPAVCGMPLLVSREFLLKHENFDRALYSGFLGPISSTSADLFVNLRCMQVFKHTARLYAGAGVVKGSVPENEWLETEEKMNTLQRFL